MLTLRAELVKYVKKIIGDIPDVEDIVQDAILSSLEKKASLQNPENYKQWLFRIARNKSIDFMGNKRKDKPEANDAEILYVYPDEGNTILTLAENNKHVYDRVKELFLVEHKSSKEIKAYLISINPDVTIVSEEYIEALLLSEFKHLKQQDIASFLDIPLSTAKSRIQRAKLKAQEVFFRCCRFEFDTRGNVIDYTPLKK